MIIYKRDDGGLGLYGDCISYVIYYYNCFLIINVI